MHKTKTILFLCLSLLFTAQTIAELRKKKLPTIQTAMAEEAQLVSTTDPILNYEINQSSFETLFTALSTGSGATAFLGGIGQAPTDSLPLFSGAAVDSTSTISTSSLSFTTAITTSAGPIYITHTTHSSSQDNQTRSFTGSSTSQALNSALARSARMATFALDTSVVFLLAIQASGSKNIIYQMGAPHELTSTPTQTLGTFSVDDGSDLAISSSENYLSTSFLSGGNGIILTATRKNHSPTELNIIHTTNVGPCTKTPSTFTNRDGSVTIVLIDDSQRLIHKVIDKNGSLIKTTIIDDTVTEFYFSANNHGGTLAYAKTDTLYATSAAYPIMYGEGDFARGKPYMIGTKPKAQQFQAGNSCFGGKNASNFHQVFASTISQPTSTLIYTSSTTQSTTLSFLWATVPTNNTIPREERGFGSPDISNTLINTGVTSVYSPAKVLENINNTLNKLKT